MAGAAVTGAQVGRYRLLRLVSQGPRGSVHEAVAPGEAPVALRRLQPRGPLPPDAAERLRRAALAARAVDHPGVVRPLDAGVADGAAFVTHELLPGARPLQEAAASLSLPDRLRLVRDAARALGAAHARAVVHGDLSPDDVLVDASGRVRVTDLGLACLAGHGPPAAPASDVAALGRLLRDVARGAPPGHGLEPPPALARLIDAAQAERPEARPRDGEALAAALDLVLAGLVTVLDGSPPLTPQPAGPQGPRSSARLTAVLGPGSRVGRYTLVAKLGAGGMGQVWRARDEQLGREVALKLVPTPGGDQRKRALRELEAAARVRHANVVAVHDAGEAPGGVFLVMDLVEGHTLERLLREGPLEPRRAVGLAIGLAQALEALHAHGVVHRDLKPGNVLVDPGGAPRLMDFGVAQVREGERLTRTNQLVGTPLYMAPEQLAGRAVDERADVYGLAAVLFEALCGRAPVQADTLVALVEAKRHVPPAPSSVRAGLPASLDAVLLQALDPDPAARYASMRALREDLERWAAGARVAARAAPWRARRLVAAGAAAALAVAGPGAWLLLRDPAPAPAAAGASLTAELPRARRLLELDPARLEAALAALPPGDGAAAERRRLGAWLGLALAARDDLAGAAARVEPADASPEGRALRGALAALSDGDPTAALADLEAARAALRAAELEGWRLRAVSRRGVEDEAEAASLLAALEGERPGLDAASAARLEVQCLAALGRRAEAELALGRLEQPDDELRWRVALLGALDHARTGRLDAVQRALEGLARPPGPPRPDELAVAAAAFEAIVPLLEGRAVRVEGDFRERVRLGVELHTRLAPGALPIAWRDALLRWLAGMALGPGAWEIALATLEGCPGDPVVAEHCMPLLTSDPPAAADRRRCLRAARQVLALPGGERFSAHLVVAYQLVALGDADALEPALRAFDADLSARPPPDARWAATLRGQWAMHRAWLHGVRGQAQEALAVLDAASGLPELRAGERAVLRLRALLVGGRREAALALALEHAAAPLPQGLRARHEDLAHLVWEVLAPAGRHRELRPMLDRLDQRTGGQSAYWKLRRAFLLAALDELDAAAEDLLDARRLDPARAAAIDAAVVERFRLGDHGARLTLMDGVWAPFVEELRTWTAQ